MTSYVKVSNTIHGCNYKKNGDKMMKWKDNIRQITGEKRKEKRGGWKGPIPTAVRNLDGKNSFYFGNPSSTASNGL